MKTQSKTKFSKVKRMINSSYTLLINNKMKLGKPATKFYLIPNNIINAEQSKDLKFVCNKKIDGNLPEHEYNKIRNVFASIAEDTEWISPDVPDCWRRTFTKYKTNTPVYCPNITSVILLS